MSSPNVLIGDPLFMLPGFPIKLEMTKIYYFTETLIFTYLREKIRLTYKNV